MVVEDHGAITSQIGERKGGGGGNLNSDVVVTVAKAVWHCGSRWWWKVEAAL